MKPDFVFEVGLHFLERRIQEKGYTYDDFMIVSFHHYDLLECKKRNKKIATGAILQGIPIGYAQFATQAQADVAVLSFKHIHQEFIDDARQRGLKVFVYTVNDKDDIVSMKAMGVDGIASDFPDHL